MITRASLRIGAAVAAAVLAGLVVSPAVEAAPSNGKVTICHRTHSMQNPYRLITVSASSVMKKAGHKGHTGPVFDGIVRVWGDVIPGGDADGAAFNGSNAIALNWSTGKAFFPGGELAAKCRKMTTKEYFLVETQQGKQDPAAVARELNEQEASEDALARKTVGGTFTSENLNALPNNGAGNGKGKGNKRPIMPGS